MGEPEVSDEIFRCAQSPEFFQERSSPVKIIDPMAWPVFIVRPYVGYLFDLPILAWANTNSATEHSS
jgi:hypothetical protein